MASFKNKMKNRKIVGNKKFNSSEALGLVFNDSTKKVIDIKISALSSNPYQPRLNINQAELEELMNSIDSCGQLQPIIITPIDNNPNKFYIVAGHRRVAALKALNKELVSAISYQASQEDLRIYSIVENLQRENLSVIEEATAIKSLVDIGMKQVDIVKKLGKSKTSISRLVKISSLNKDLIDYIKTNNEKVGLNILEELCNVESKIQLKVYKYIKDKSLDIDAIKKYVNLLNKENINKPSSTFSGFSFNQKKNKINFKLDLDLLQDKSEAIQTLEKILVDLKN
jgi:ParB family chromosome partitioning protein